MLSLYLYLQLITLPCLHLISYTYLHLLIYTYALFVLLYELAKIVEILGIWKLRRNFLD